MSWTPTKHTIRKILKGQTKTVTFKRLDETKDIKSLHSTCACTEPKYKDGVLTVTYRAKFPDKKRLPIHVSTQTVTVKYEDGTLDKLQIQANVYKRW